MKPLVEYIAQSIASNPDEVRVTEEGDEDRVYVRLQVAPEDKGKVIGRDGRVAQSIRSLLRVAAVKQDVHTVLEIE
ncbi:MAG: KH domain-containing protein [Dehalococcoidia bacterium]|nr:KH domain-containing protein [Chloroflexota bacterium]MXY43514.1 KH domain-containing protein [Dehalococcoidia bacterium]MYB49175.1 KH domain-containing protein [Dehalococcoidia bacterium]